MRSLTNLGWMSLTLLGVSACGAGVPDLGECSDCVGKSSQALSTTNDLTITHIQRLPLIDYVVNSSNPTVQGWPAAGQVVTWRAFAKNFSSTARNGVKYDVYWDATKVKSGQVNVPANGTANVDYARAWDFGRHTLRVVIDPTNLVSEQEEQNNQLSVITNAISLGLWVEQSVYDYFKDHQRELVGAHSTCWENWAQRQVNGYNARFASAIFPESPNGVLDRIRLDEIVVTPDGSLPLHGGFASTNNPNQADHTVNLEHGFPSGLVPAGPYIDTVTANDNNPFYYEEGTLHELLHARYLIDNYSLNVHNDGQPIPQRDTIPQIEKGRPVIGTPFMPKVQDDAVFMTAQAGVMADAGTQFIGRYSAVALNQLAGRRAVNGNMNPPVNIGVFVNDLPAENRIRLLDDATGAPLAGAVVNIYQASVTPTPYGKNFSSTPALRLTANANGEILTGRNPFSNGPIPWTSESSVMLLRVFHNDRVRYQFVEVPEYNLEFWRGHTTMGNYTVRVPFVGGLASPVLGFENTTFWSTTAGSLGRVTSPTSDGAAALQISGIGYAELTSAALSDQDSAAGGRLAVDLLMPQLQPNPAWLGQLQIFVNCPSRGVFNAFVGAQDLTGLPLETYNTLTFNLPSSVTTSLQQGPYTDLTIKVALNVTAGSGRHLLDNLRFLP